MHLHPLMKSFALAALLLVAAGARAETNEDFEYQVIEPPVPTETGDKIEVVELFWYGCPHCYRLEPYIKGWLPTLPQNVEFRRIPAVFSERWALHARAFYTAEALGVLDKVHDALFHAIHEEHKRLDKEEEIAKIFAEQGISEEQFTETFHSFFIDSKVRRAKALTKAYGIDGVPAIIVDGKYRTNGTLAGGQEEMLQVVDSLIKRESQPEAAAVAGKPSQ